MISFTPKRGFYNELRSFYEVLTNNNRDYVKPDVAFDDVKIIFSILESAKTNKSVRIDEKITFFSRIALQKR